VFFVFFVSLREIVFNSVFSFSRKAAKAAKEIRIEGMVFFAFFVSLREIIFMWCDKRRVIQ